MYLVGVEDELAFVGDMCVDDVYVLVGGAKHDDCAGQVAHGRTVPVVVLEPEFQSCTLSYGAFECHSTTTVLGVHLDEGQPEADLACGARGGIGVGDLGEEFWAHALAVVFDCEMVYVVFKAVADSESYQ